MVIGLQQKLDAIMAEVVVAENRVAAATLDANEAREMLASNDNRGVQCVSAKQKAVEHHERGQRDVRRKMARDFCGVHETRCRRLASDTPHVAGNSAIGAFCPCGSRG